MSKNYTEELKAKMRASMEKEMQEQFEKEE
jgi:hypothetical protein